MKRLFTLLLVALAMLSMAACGSDAGKAAPKAENTAPAQIAAEAKPPSDDANKAKSKMLVAYFSCTGNTKALAEKAAKALGADIYEIRPQVPYTSNDLNYNDETTRATAEQKDDSARPALADNNAGIENYDAIVLAYPIWWGQAPRIMDTFVESYDFAGRTIFPSAPPAAATSAPARIIWQSSCRDKQIGKVAEDLTRVLRKTKSRNG